MARRPSRRDRGQVLGLAALLLFVLVGFAAVAVDAGMNFVDRRSLQAAADQGALAGAAELSISTQAALSAGQGYAWKDLHVTAPSYSCGSTASVCTATYGTYPQTGSYQVVVTIGFTTPVDSVKHNYQYSSQQVVTVDVVHVDPRIGFEGALGFGAVTVRSHAAAIAHEGLKKFPFAIATRFLDLQGSGTATAFGAVLIGQCSDGGVGDFVDKNNNGGLFFNGGSTLVLGSAGTANGIGGYSYTSAQGVLLANPAYSDKSVTATCTGSNGNLDADANWNVFGNGVSFTSGSTDFNYYYGFTSGPLGCDSTTSDEFYCTASSIGDGLWQDSPCWKQISNGQAAPINSTPLVYTGGSVPSGVGSGTACSSSAGSNTYEGSFYSGKFPTFPVYSDPIAVLSSSIFGSGVPAALPSGATNYRLTSGGTINAGDYSDTGGSQFYVTQYSAGSGANLTFKPGFYVFDGTAASVTLSNNSSWSCASPSPTDKLQGCAFIFRNGAYLDVQSSSASVNCSAAEGNGNQYGNCSFEFADFGVTPSYLSLTNRVSVYAHPILYTTQDGTAARFPLIYANGKSNCVSPPNSTPNSLTHCAINMSQPGTFDIGGTIYAPNGVININANGAAASGQVVADTVLMQTGASAVVTGVAYKGDEVAPVLGPSTLIE